jgi:hypothetical protein
MAAYSFFQLTAPPALSTEDALPGISASEEDFLALIEAVHETIDAFQEEHPDLTYGDAIHAILCVKHNLIDDFISDTADA